MLNSHGITHAPNRMTGLESGLSQQDLLMTLLGVLSGESKPLPMSNLYQAVNQAMAPRGGTLSDGGKASLRNLVNKIAVDKGLLHPHNDTHPGWTITSEGETFLSSHVRCAHCGVSCANTEQEVEVLFGFRKTRGKIRPQSWCRSCRASRQNNTVPPTIESTSMDTTQDFTETQLQIIGQVFNLGPEALRRASEVLINRGLQPHGEEQLWFSRRDLQHFFNYNSISRNRSHFTRLRVPADQFYITVDKEGMPSLLLTHILAIVAATLTITTSGAKAVRPTGRYKKDKAGNKIEVLVQATSDLNRWKSFRDEISAAVQVPYLLGNNKGKVFPQSMQLPSQPVAPTPLDQDSLVPEPLNLVPEAVDRVSDVTIQLNYEGVGQITSHADTLADAVAEILSQINAADLPQEDGVYQYQSGLAAVRGGTYRRIWPDFSGTLALIQSNPKDWGEKINLLAQ